MSHSPFDIRLWNDNPWSTIADRWMLITAGNGASWNTMTASWGGFGHLWNRDVAFVFVRPTRHTFGFMESSEFFSLCFFGEEHRKMLEVCGSVSGRDCDKAALTGLLPLEFGLAGDCGLPLSPGLPRSPGTDGKESRVVGFGQAEIVLVCRKMHAQDIDPAGFADPDIAKHYKAADWHRLYVASVEAAWKRD
jgi:flavin reductase (DIM6/NTAB) family NADH-FMN oxidoreductase RutF